MFSKSEMSELYLSLRKNRKGGREREGEEGRERKGGRGVGARERWEKGRENT
jgi:hypothetical protein